MMYNGSEWFDKTPLWLWSQCDGMCATLHYLGLVCVQHYIILAWYVHEHSLKQINFPVSDGLLVTMDVGN